MDGRKREGGMGAKRYEWIQKGKVGKLILQEFSPELRKGRLLCQMTGRSGGR